MPLVCRVPCSAFRVARSVFRGPRSEFRLRSTDMHFWCRIFATPSFSAEPHGLIPPPFVPPFTPHRQYQCQQNDPSSNRSQIHIRNSHNKTSTKRPHTANMAPDNLGWPQIAPDSLRWLQMAPDGLRWPRMAPDGSDGLRSPYIRRLE